MISGATTALAVKTPYVIASPAGPASRYAGAIVTGGAVGVEFRQVAYPVEDVQAAAMRSGRPHADEWAAQWSGSG